MSASITIAQRVRDQIANVLEDDLKGGEAIMKEVWERCLTDTDTEVACDELRRIIAWLRLGPTTP